MAIGPFQWVCIVAATAFLPRGFWERGRIIITSIPHVVSGNPQAFKGGGFPASAAGNDVYQKLLSRLSRRPLSIKPSRVSGPCILLFLFCVFCLEFSALYPAKFPLPRQVDAVVQR